VRRNRGESGPLVVGSLLSILFLGGFAFLQAHGSPILRLDAKWVAAAGVPLLVALIVGGYITKFKGFGFELETSLNSPVSSVALKVAEAIATVPGDEKESIARLPDFTRDQIARTKRLSFVSGRRQYYGVEAVMRYFKALRSLEYVEVKAESGEFLCLIPIQEFQRRPGRTREQFSYPEIDRFLEALGQGNVCQDYGHVCISLSVRRDESLVAVLESLRQANRSIAAVTNAEKQFIGVVTEQDIEHRIVEAVLASKLA